MEDLEKGKQRDSRGNRARRSKHKSWIVRRDRRRFQKPRFAVMKHRSIAQLLGCINEHTRSSIVRTAEEAYEVTLPARLDFDENYEASVSHLTALRHASRQRLRIKSLRFHDLKSISPAAALVLASEVDRWNQCVGGRLKAQTDSWSEPIKRLLFQMGYFELLGLAVPSDITAEGSTTFLKFLHGETGKDDPGKLSKQLREGIEVMVGQQIHRQELFDGLSEAITNVSHHAYPMGHLVGGKKQWWLSASFDSDNRNLRVMFYDQGIGIPNTLPTSHFWESIKQYFHRWKDSQKIEAAMVYGRTSTTKPQHGKGLQSLQEFAKAYENGQLSIYSRFGLYRMVHSSDDRVIVRQQDHKRSAGGTLIEWSVTL